MRLSLVFGGVSLGFGILSRVVPLLVVIVAGDLGRILATRTSPTRGTKRIDTGDGGRVLSLLLSISMTLLPLLLLPSLPIGGLAILEPREIWM